MKNQIKLNCKKNVLITGASIGIGYELSKLFAQDGYNLVLVARNEEKLKQMADELKEKFGISTKVISKDLSVIKSPKEIFDEMFRISKNQIIFGGNYFTEFLPPSNCWIVWDKLSDLKLGKQIPFAHCELLWTSFKITVRKYTLRQQGFINDSKDVREHPTQKPSELLKAILTDFSKKGELILDPFLGSGTTAVACKQLNRNFIGIEISPEYCKIAQDRIDKVHLTKKYW